MELKDLIALMEAAKKNEIDRFVYETETEKIVIRKKTAKTVKVNQKENIVKANKAEVHYEVETSEVQEESLHMDNENIVTSPLVGTFYSSPSPDAKPFVSVGDSVKKRQLIAIIEAMKLMNEIESEFDGVVEAVLVKDESVVEFGQPLFRIR